MACPRRFLRSRVFRPVLQYSNDWKFRFKYLSLKCLNSVDDTWYGP